MEKIGKRLISGSFFRVVALMINLVIGFTLMPFVIHSLGDRYYGYWALISIIMGYYGLFDMGIVSSVQFHVAKSVGAGDHEKRNRIINTTLMVFLALSTLIAAVTVILVYNLNLFIKDPAELELIQKCLLIMGIGFALEFPFRVFLGVASAYLRFDAISLANIITVVTRALMIVYFLKGGHGLLALTIITFSMNVMMHASHYFIARYLTDGFKLSAKYVEPSLLKEILGYSVYRFVEKVAEQLKNYFSYFIVSMFLGVALVTKYAIISRLSMYSINLTIAIFGLLAPVFSLYLGKKQDDEIKSTYTLGIKFSIAISAIMMSDLLFYGKDFIRTWVGQNYTDVYLPFAILLVGTYSYISQFPGISYMQGVAKNRFLALITILEAGISIGLCLLLVQSFGLLGIAIGFSIPVIVIRIFVQPIYITGLLQVSFVKYFVEIFLKGTLLAGLGIFVPYAVFFRKLNYGSLALVLLIMVVQVLITLPVLYYLYFKRDERQLIKDNGIVPFYNKGVVIVQKIIKQTN